MDGEPDSKLATKSTRAPEGVSVESKRLVRERAYTTLSITISPGLRTNRTVISQSNCSHSEDEGGRDGVLYHCTDEYDDAAQS